ncbi:MAG: hypothetical protein INQ03_24095 [Candidatus Heimdallarchaeota archaeon]|nr:hypothetical protein [Candidatus Heimdallarchaeota archaeon]
MEDEKVSIKRNRSTVSIGLPVVMIMIWAIAYQLLILDIGIIQLVPNFVNFFTSLLTDGFLIVAIGIMLVGIYAIFITYFEFLSDPFGFSKMEQIWRSEAGNFSIRRFVMKVHDIDKMNNPTSPIPSSTKSVLISLILYYFVNFTAYFILIEIFFLEIFGAAGQLDTFSTENEIFLPIIVAAIPIGLRITALAGWHHVEKYAEMLTELIYFFLLLGMLSTIFETSIASFADLLRETGGIGRFMALLLYLAILPIIFEITYWLNIQRKEQEVNDSLEDQPMESE